MSKPVILTGLRANNDLHIGNYFGALLPMIDMAQQKSGDYQINLFVPDLHSFTTPIDHSQLQAQILHNVKLFVAAGLPLDNANIFVYRQSQVSAHSELTWILSCFTGMGEMSRMTQYKDKSLKLVTESDSQVVPETNNPLSSDEIVILANEEQRQRRVSVGLLNYPILMAADILLYGASYIPVGDDQSQHLEFTRKIAHRMNALFNEPFSVPKPVKEQHEFFGKDQGLRIRDLQDPTKKMSKSDDSSKGVIFLGDEPEAAVKKVMSAATDSEGSIHMDYAKQPGVSNLLQISALLSQQPLAELAVDWEGKDSYGELKTVVADQVRAFLSDFQDRLAKVDEAQLLAKLERDETAMREVANQTLLRVQKAIGLRS